MNIIGLRLRYTMRQTTLYEGWSALVTRILQTGLNRLELLPSHAVSSCIGKAALCIAHSHLLRCADRDIG
jgi:hypothetical protein